MSRTLSVLHVKCTAAAAACSIIREESTHRHTSTGFTHQYARTCPQTNISAISPPAETRGQSEGLQPSFSSPLGLHPPALYFHRMVSSDCPDRVPSWTPGAPYSLPQPTPHQLPLWPAIQRNRLLCPQEPPVPPRRPRPVRSHGNYIFSAQACCLHYWHE